MNQLTIGNYTITWLEGGVTNMDGGAVFGVVPKPLWSQKYPVNDNNQVPMPTDPLLIQGEGRNILVDAGLGNGRLSKKQQRNYGVTEESNVEQSLREMNLYASDIDAVLMTHMHFDHASGLAREEQGQSVPVFRNAVIHVSETEWEEMKNPNIRSENTYWEKNWKPVAHQVETFESELQLTGNIRMVHTGGHSAGMSIILIEDESSTLIHMADNMPTHAHQNVLWVTAYDDYPMDSVYMKENYMNWGCQRHAWFTFYHDELYRALKFNPSGEVIEAVTREKLNGN